MYLLDKYRMNLRKGSFKRAYVWNHDMRLPCMFLEQPYLFISL